MNYLAHIFLSGNDDAVKIGNFIADGIKGKKYTEYPTTVQKGILLHRAIDTYTDAHDIVKLSTKKLHSNHGHYSGVIVDMFYDHFLAKNWSSYSSIPLNTYALDFYNLLEQNYDMLPERIHRMMPYMITNNWLAMYADFEGIDTILKQMHHKTKFRGNLDKAYITLEKYYTTFEQEFTTFFNELVTFSTHELVRIEHHINSLS